MNMYSFYFERKSPFKIELSPALYGLFYIHFQIVNCLFHVLALFLIFNLFTISQITQLSINSLFIIVQVPLLQECVCLLLFDVTIYSIYANKCLSYHIFFHS